MSEFYLDEPEAVRALEDALDDSRKEEIGRMAVQAMANPDKFLSPEETRVYEKAQQSIVDARESAIRNEGHNTIF